MTDLDRLAEIAQELVVRVRDEDPQSNGRWLEATTTDEDRWALLFVLAAAVPDDRPWKHLTLWTYGDGRPDTDEAIEARRQALLEETTVVGPAAVGSNQYVRKRKAA